MVITPYMANKIRENFEDSKTITESIEADVEFLKHYLNREDNQNLESVSSRTKPTEHLH